jgi:hypothetical protein
VGGTAPYKKMVNRILTGAKNVHDYNN